MYRLNRKHWETRANMITLSQETSIEANDNDFNILQNNPDTGSSNGEAFDSDAHIMVQEEFALTGSDCVFKIK